METEVKLSHKVITLMEKGVKVPAPFSIDIGEEINLDRISGDGVILYPGTRIYGAKTLISRGARLGYEAPATVVDCQLGVNVELKGGFFKSSAFLEKSNMGYGAQVREGCILEEEASASHTVGLKQTILFPFVTLGSLINFCDCFMSGGTSRKNHSEVGSSYIHFNYTPHQDKATPSLIGDIPRGVMLDQPPIFLGGQGGMVGPVRIGYGTVIAAGTVFRRDCPEGNTLVAEKVITVEEEFFQTGFYRHIKRRVYNNICYLANLLALRQWYVHVRQPFFRREAMGSELYAGVMDTLDSAVEERVNRFKALSEKMKTSIELGKNILGKSEHENLFRQKKEFCENWSKIEAAFTGGVETNVDIKNRDAFVTIIHEKMRGNSDYIKVIQSLDKEVSVLGTVWLQKIVDHISSTALGHLPSHRS